MAEAAAGKLGSWFCFGLDEDHDVGVRSSKSSKISPENTLQRSGGSDRRQPIKKLIGGFCSGLRGESIGGVIFSNRRVDSPESTWKWRYWGFSPETRGRRSSRGISGVVASRHRGTVAPKVTQWWQAV